MPQILTVDAEKLAEKLIVKTMPDGSTKRLIPMLAKDRALFGNYMPVIVTSPGGLARAFAEKFSAHFRGAPVVTSFLLQNTYSRIEGKWTEIWESLGEEITGRYRCAIFIIED